MGKKHSIVTRMKGFLFIGRRELIGFFVGVFSTTVLFLLALKSTDSRSPLALISSYLHALQDENSIPIPMEQFPEPAWRTPNTLAARTITSTPFARFEIHKVKTESGDIVNDWLWTDERSHVNILVHLKAEDKYLLFKQRKYGLERDYFATIGGLFNEGDTPLGCAQRELLEETGLEAEEWISLGAYRVQVNRGGGILHAYLAKNSFPSSRKKKSDDYEKQEHRLLTRDEVIEVALQGEVGEAQWAATVALGLLHEEHREHHDKPTAKVNIQ
jgi:ADP-ribose pyrophosphatase